MGFVDHIGAAHANHDILGVVGHAHDFVGDDLADGENQVIVVPEDIVCLDLDFVIHLAIGEFRNHLGGDFAQGTDAIAPVVDLECALGNAGAEHHFQLRIGHGLVGAQGGHDVDMALSAVVFPDHRRDGARVGIQAGVVGGKQEHPLRGLARGGDGLVH